MKRIKTLVICLITFTSLSAQDSLTTKRKKHEIGIDFTYFIKNYIYFGEYYNPNAVNKTFYFQYRFHFKSNNNIRAAIGGGFYNTETESPSMYDVNKYKNKQQALNFRIGFEHFENISRKFQLFYGLDLISLSSFQINDASSFGNGYANGYETREKAYGVAPLLGIRYKINKRLSVFTETSFQVNITKTWQYRYLTPMDAAYPVIPNGPRIESKLINSTFNFPFFIVLAFDI